MDNLFLLLLWIIGFLSVLTVGGWLADKLEEVL